MTDEFNPRLSPSGPYIDGGPSPPSTTTQGPQGAPGFDGDPGDEGMGWPGAPGAAGATGAQGLQGAPGFDGDVGDEGFPGAPGPAGPSGAQGLQGAPGYDGVDGDDGAAVTGAGQAAAQQLAQLVPPKGVTLTAGGAQFAATNIPAYNVVQGTAPVGSLGFAVNSLAEWAFSLRGYQPGTAITLTIYWYAAAVTGNVKWQASLGAITGNVDATSMEAKAYAAAVATQSAVSANAKALNLTVISISGASLDSASPDDFVQLQIQRVAASASEMSGNALFLFAVVGFP